MSQQICQQNPADAKRHSQHSAEKIVGQCLQLIAAYLKIGAAHLQIVAAACLQVVSACVQVLESSSGGRSGSLMGALDQCCSPAGKRLLSQWLCRPLLRIADIRARQDAVQALMAPDCAEAVGAARKALAGQPHR